MTDLSQHIETVKNIDGTSAAGYVISSSGIIAGFTLDEIDLILRIFSVVIGFIGLCGTLWISWHFKSLNYKLNAREIKHRKPRKKEEKRK